MANEAQRKASRTIVEADIDWQQGGGPAQGNRSRAGSVREVGMASAVRTAAQHRPVLRSGSGPQVGVWELVAHTPPSVLLKASNKLGLRSWFGTSSIAVCCV